MADSVYRNQLVPDRGAVYDTTQLNPNVIHEVRDNGSGLNALVGTLDKWLAEGHKQLDKETIRKAQIAGSTAGLFLDYKEMEGDTLAAETFNRAGGETFLNNKLSTVSTYMHKMTIDPAYRNDPVKMEHALDKGRAEYLKDVPVSLLPDFVTAYNDRMGRALQSAQTNHMNMVISANAAKFLEMETTHWAEITNAARSGDEAAVNQARTEYFRRIDAQVGLSLTPEEAAKKKIALQSQVQKDVVIGDFMRTPPAERATFVENFIKTNPLGHILQASEVDDLKREMISSWNANDKLKETADAELTATNKKVVDTVKAEFHLAPTNENYMKLVTMKGATPEDISSARSYMERYVDNPDPVLVNSVEDMIFAGKIAEANEVLADPETAPRIGQKPMQKLRNMIADTQAGSGFEQTEGYKEVTRRINEDYSDFGGLKMAGKVIRQQVYDELRTNYPKYLRGELPYSDVDPIRIYQLKKSSNMKTESSVQGHTISTKDGPVVLPTIYVDDPDQFFRDRKTGMDPRLSKNKDVIDHVNRLRVERDKKLKAEQSKGSQ